MALVAPRWAVGPSLITTLRAEVLLLRIYVLLRALLVTPASIDEAAAVSDIATTAFFDY